jgi:hypothetical protein
MNRPAATGALLVAAALAAPAGALAQQVLGRLVDWETSAPVLGATIQLIDVHAQRVAASATTDTAGRFNLRAPDVGIYHLKYVRFGYEVRKSIPMLIDTAGDALVDATISQDSLMREATRAPSSAAMAAPYFDSRRSANIGTVMMQADIAMGGYTDVAQMVRKTGLMRVVGDASPHWAATLASTPANGKCIPALFINGTRLNALGGQFSTEAADLLFGMPVSAVWALEVYGSVRLIPGIYEGSGLSCGAIALWTRRP